MSDDRLNASSSNREFSDEEANLIDETFNIIRNLNKDIKQVETKKQQLQTDIQKLNAKVEGQPRPESQQPSPQVLDKVHEDLTHAVKKELLNEFEPLLKRLQNKPVATDINKELSSLLDSEFAKLRSELSAKNQKTKQDVTKQLKGFEQQLNDALKKSQILKQNFKGSSNSKEQQKLVNEIETFVNKSIEKHNKKLASLYNSTINEVDNLKQIVSLNKDDVLGGVKDIQKFKKEVAKQLKEDGVEITSFETKLLKLEQDYTALQKLLGKFEDDLYTKKTAEINQVEGQFKRTSTLVDKKLVELDKATKAQEEFIVEKVNRMIEKINKFDEKSGERLKAQSEKLQEKLDKLNTKTLDKVTKSEQKFSELTQKEREGLRQEYDVVKEELKGLLSSKVAELEEQFNDISELSAKRDAVVLEKVKDVVDLHAKDINDVFKGITQLKTEFKVSLKGFEEKAKKQNLKEQARLEKDIEAHLHKRTAELEKVKEQTTKQIDKKTQSLDKIGDKLLVQVDKKIQSLDGIQSNLSDLEQQFSTLSEEVEGRAKDVSHELMKTTDRVAKLDEKNTQKLQTQTEKLKEQLDKLNMKTLVKAEALKEKFTQASQKDKEALEQQLQVLRNDLKSKVDEVTDLSTKRDAVVLDKIKHVVELHGKDIDDVLAGIASLKQEFKGSLKEFEEQAKEKNTKTQEKLILHIEKKAEQLHKAKDKIAATVDTKLQSIKNVEASLTSVEKEQHQFKEELQGALDEALAHTEKQIKAIEQLQEKDADHILKQVKETKAFFSSYLKSFEEKLKDKNTKSQEKLQKSIEKFKEQAVRDIDKKLTRIDTVEKLVESQEEHIEKAVQSQVAKGISTLDKTKEDLVSYLDQKTQLVHEVEKDFKDLSKRFDQLTHETEGHQESVLARIQEAVDTQERAAQEIETELSQAKNTLQDEVAAAQVNLESSLQTTLEGRKDELESYIDEKLSALNDVRQELLNVIDARMENVIESKDHIVHALEEKEKNLEQLQSDFSTLAQSKMDEMNASKEEVHSFIAGEKKEIDAVKEGIRKEYQKDLKSFDEKFAKLVVKNSDFMTNLSTQEKEYRRELSEDAEKKFYDLKQTYDATFDKQLDRFQETLKTKESEFVQKIVAVENDKEHALAQFKHLEEHFTKTTKETFDKFQSKLSEIVLEKKTFDNEVEQLDHRIKHVMDEARKELGSYSQTLEQELKSLIARERESFEQHEDSFREVFTDKMSHMNEYLKKRLDTLDKKFLEKQHKIFAEMVKDQVNSLEELRSSVNSSLTEFDKKAQGQENKVTDYFAGIETQKKELVSHLDEKVEDLHKSMNKRLVDFDSQFTHFKGIVIDEVEGMMKEMKGALGNKGKGGMIASSEIEAVEKEMKNLWNAHSELKKQLSIISPTQTINGMNSVVNGLIDYENNLISMVESLKRRGVSDETIQEALANKGHPRLYVSMVLETMH